MSHASVGGSSGAWTTLMIVVVIIVIEFITLTFVTFIIFVVGAAFNLISHVVSTVPFIQGVFIVSKLSTAGSVLLFYFLMLPIITSASAIWW